MKHHTVGFLGFGKAACIFAEDMLAAGFGDIVIYDKNWNVEPFGSTIRQNAERLSARLVTSPSELAAQASMVLSMVVPVSSEEALKSVAPFLSDGTFYIDLNSVSPVTKKRSSEFAHEVNPLLHYIDGCILGAVSENRIRTPILLCGRESEGAEEFLARCGAKIEVIDGEPGDASAVKMIRSVFMKGIETLFIETLHAAQAYNIQKQVVATIKDTFETLTFDQLINMLVTTHSIHGKRRQGEMMEVIDTLIAKNVDATMSQGIYRKFGWSVNLKLSEYFEGSLPDRLETVIETIYNRAKESSFIENLI